VSLLRIMMEQTAAETVPNRPSNREPEAADKGKEEKTRAGDRRKDDSRWEPALFAATNLAFWETDKPHYYARDVGIDGTCFRRLDPEYYAWLRHKMTLARKAADSGRLSAGAFEELRTRFNAIHAWAIERFGEDALRSAVQALDPKAYSPPSTETPGTAGPRTNRQDSRFGRAAGAPEGRGPRMARVKPQGRPASPPAAQDERHLYPKDGDWPFTHPVPPSAVAKVDAIRIEAVAKGWREARLYQNRGRFRFPCGEDYGLVCFVDGDERIGEITRQSIEIVGPPPRETVLRFYNPDVEQPWHRKSAGTH